MSMWIDLPTLTKLIASCYGEMRRDKRNTSAAI